jgi:Ser/Thr protein kinase RdoA (MazF antagonist)
VIREQILHQAARRYGADAATLSPLAGGHFTHVYAFEREGDAYVLRLTPPNEEIDLVAMRAILAWVTYLVDHGASVTRPTPSEAGHLVETIQDGDAVILVTAVEKARGVLGETLRVEQWTPPVFEALGRVVGKLHAVTETYQPAAPELQRPHWNGEHGLYYLQTPGIPPLVAEKAAPVLAEVKTLPRDPSGYGLIHGDLHGGNFFVDLAEPTLTLFDFDDCLYGWYVMDIAMSVFDMLVLTPEKDKAAFAHRFLRHYLRGYTRERPLEARWLAQLPHFLKLVELDVYTQVYPHHDPRDVTSWVGRFMQDRTSRIRNDAPYVALDIENVFEACFRASNAHPLDDM